MKALVVAAALAVWGGASWASTVSYDWAWTYVQDVELWTWRETAPGQYEQYCGPEFCGQQIVSRISYWLGDPDVVSGTTVQTYQGTFVISADGQVTDFQVGGGNCYKNPQESYCRLEGAAHLLSIGTTPGYWVVQPVPVPASGLLLATAGLLLLWRRRTT